MDTVTLPAPKPGQTLSLFTKEPVEVYGVPGGPDPVQMGAGEYAHFTSTNYGLEPTDGLH